jgi:DNA-binding response OmpR family regulator
VTDRVLLIEDDADIALGVRTMLSRNGFAVTTAGDGREGLRAFHGQRPDIVILDVGLPEMDGWTVLERIRELSEVPVLMLTAHGQESDKVRGLRTGADDYVTKPFGNAEFVARVRALLRRAGIGEQPAAGDVYDDGRVRVNFAAHEVLADGVPVELTATEYRLLVTLVRHRGQVLSAARLLDLVWNDPVGIGPERVKYSVMRLRRKLGATSGADSPIEAVRGFGYRYRAGRNRPAPLRQPGAHAAGAECPRHEILRFPRDIRR